MRELDARVRVLPEQPQRAGSHRLGQRLRAQVGGPDRVGVVDHGGPARVVASERQRQAEGEHQPDEREERPLHDPDRLAQRLGLAAQHAAAEIADGHEPEHDRGDDQPQLPGAQPEEHRQRISEQRSRRDRSIRVTPSFESWVSLVRRR